MAFGKLVDRWAILRKPLNVNFGLSKMMALVLPLCRLHNFCIGETLLQNDTSTDTDNRTIELLAMDRSQNYAFIWHLVAFHFICITFAFHLHFT